MLPENSLAAPPNGAPAGRKPRADGVESRRTILRAAASLATTRGLEALSIGELARHIGMSKSGLYAHFESKEDLELATIDTAAEIFESEVLAAGAGPTGLERVWAVSEAFLQHLKRRIFPGGCFFASVSMQLASRPGPARDRVMDLLRLWQQTFTDALGQAVAAGELARETDIDQAVFEITGMLMRANFAWMVTGDAGVLDRARTAIRHALERAPAPRKSTTSRKRKRGWAKQ